MNLSDMMMVRAFCRAFLIVQTLSGQLSWSQNVELLSIEDSSEHGFYEKQTLLT